MAVKKSIKKNEYCDRCGAQLANQNEAEKEYHRSNLCLDTLKNNTLAKRALHLGGVIKN